MTVQDAKKVFTKGKLIIGGNYYWVFKMIKNIFLLMVLLPLISCNPKTEKENEKIQASTKSYVEDVFFKRNTKLTYLEIRINKVEKISVDTLIMNSLLAIAMPLKNDNSKPYLNDPKWIKLKELQKKYSTNQIGFQVICYMKGTQTDINSGKSRNFLLDNLFFKLDDNYQVFDTGLIFND